MRDQIRYHFIRDVDDLILLLDDSPFPDRRTEVQEYTSDGVGVSAQTRGGDKKHELMNDEDLELSALDRDSYANGRIV